MPKVLIIEDDQSIADMMTIYLEEEGYTVSWGSDGEEGKKLLQSAEPDIIILDVMLPDTDGITLCGEIRLVTVIPILMVSAKKEVADRVNALLMGADDYLCKPFSMRELAARLTALLRRSAMTPVPEPAAAKESRPAVHMDMSRRVLYVADKLVETTYSEFEIMKVLWLHPNNVFSREELLNRIRGIDTYVTERSVDVHITNLRKKIEADPKNPRFIKTVWGVGYKFVPEGD
ncbi:response regulator transcription factor [Paenibacillus sp. YN15]|uniref:response regulator transcription factor n=1 Tax=Paenibacillus sp. YN15 TaxID=1742774 RepID=UPI000DCB563F|nr:response regulator transcription factor [Paenibacillus sp. YN15]RAU96570.1 DNA-binding response regulator [Paenibacillus sp. YN15]